MDNLSLSSLDSRGAHSSDRRESQLPTTQKLFEAEILPTYLPRRRTVLTVGFVKNRFHSGRAAPNPPVPFRVASQDHQHSNQTEPKARARELSVHQKKRFIACGCFPLAKSLSLSLCLSVGRLFNVFVRVFVHSSLTTIRWPLMA